LLSTKRRQLDIEFPEIMTPPSNETEELYKRKALKYERRRKKTALRKLMRKVQPRKTKAQNKKSKTVYKPMTTMEADSVRTFYEKIFESYCKLLGQPYLIDNIFCFTCGNFYQYIDTVKTPKKCQVCNVVFHVPHNKDGRTSYLARPDFVIDFNNNDARIQYKYDTNHRRVDNINLYQKEYLKKVGIIRIDGSIHNKQSQRVKDYWQYKNFREHGLKVFIVTNDDLDRLLSIKDNGKSVLELCKSIGDAIIDEGEYLKYCMDLDFIERTTRPF
jgi:hypothetical protein